MQIIPTRVHGMMDYALGLLLIAAPLLLGFGYEGAAAWVPVLLGLGVMLYSLLTDYELGAARVLAMPAHLGLDVIGGLFLAVSPWLFGFAGQVWIPHVLLGMVEIGTAAMTKRTPSYMVETGHGSGVAS